MVRELAALTRAAISVFSVALSRRASVNDVRDISSAPQLVNRNYFISPAIANLNSISDSLAAQVCYFYRFGNLLARVS